MLLKDRIALITGASRGIGAATARLFGEHGAAVAVNYVNNEKSANEVAADIEKSGGRAFVVQADVTDSEQVNSMVNKVTDALGPIDTLVHNAGLQFKMAPFTEITWEEFDAKYTGELKAAFYCCKAVVPGMIERKNGCIVAVSSGLSKRSGEGFISHAASKAGLNSFVRSLALELGPHGIRVNAVSPGLTLTDATSWMPEERREMMARFTPMRRIALPDDLAGAILFMASDLAKFITGGYLPVDGGTTTL